MSPSSNDVIDLRSDTVTRPSEAMRAAMAAAPVGDDHFGEDPTVNLLQERLAALLGKESLTRAASGHRGAGPETMGTWT
jgi:threonine aldolase